MKLPKFTALILAGALTLGVAACGKPTVDGADSRYKTNKDKISVVITKQPANKAELEKKLAEFEKEHEEALKAGSDEEKIKKLGDLNTRMEKYIAELEKASAPAGGPGAPSSKLDGGAPAGQPPAGGGGKLGAGTPPAGGAAPAGGTGMGGGTAPAGGGTGMGGTTAPPPAGGTAPAPSGGMGGM